MHFLLQNQENCFPGGEKSGIYTDPEAQDELRDVQGLLIDEAFMADQDTITEVMDICQNVPVRIPLRQPGALKLFAYRHVLLFGDLRQLPPEDSKKQ